MSRTLALIVVVALGPLLGACFHSATSLIAPEEAAFPFERFTYTVVGKPEEGELTMVRDGDVYVDPSDEEAPKARFLEIEDNLYVVQGEFTLEDHTFFAFALIKFDPEARTAELFASSTEGNELSDEVREAHGFEECDYLPGVMCFSDRVGYLDYATGVLNAGGEPDQKFVLVATE